jgi:hypothetical protein
MVGTVLWCLVLGGLDPKTNFLIFDDSLVFSSFLVNYGGGFAKNEVS